MSDEWARRELAALQATRRRRRRQDFALLVTAAVAATAAVWLTVWLRSLDHQPWWGGFLGGLAAGTCSVCVAKLWRRTR